MLTLVETWDELVRQTKALRVFRDVRAYPFERTTRAAFLEDLPALVLPACLIVPLGRATEVRGAARYRECEWGAVIVLSDPAGEAFREAAKLLDRFEGTDEHAGVLDRQALDDELTILGSCEARAVRTVPQYAVWQVSFRTREGVAR